MKSLPATSYPPLSTGIYPKLVQVEDQSLQEDVHKVGDELVSKTKTSVQQVAVTLSHHNPNADCSITRHTQINLAGVILEQWITEVFINQFQGLDDKAKAELAKALTTAFKTNVDNANKTNSPLQAPSPAIIRSPFELTPQQRNAIQKTLYKTFNADIALSYETTPHLVSGIELHVNAQKFT